LIDNHELVLSKYTIGEIEDVFTEKFPNRLIEMEAFIHKVPHEVFVLEEVDDNKYPNIRDIHDLPVLANAVESKVDILITGDKDFDDISIESLLILKPRKYVDLFMGKG